MAERRPARVLRLVIGMLVVEALVCCGGRANQTHSSSGADGANPGAAPVTGAGTTSTGGTNAEGGTSANSGGDLSEGGSGSQFCSTGNDCLAGQCASCKDAPAGCPAGTCVTGQCFYPSCAIMDACFGKMCGDRCQACYSGDGSCSPGVCDRWGDCKEVVESCEIAAPRPCAPMDAVGVGSVNGRPCNQILGWAWMGANCAPVIGCVCEGSDCRALIQAQPDCNSVFADHCSAK
jgi:hypothetical protein